MGHVALATLLSLLYCSTYYLPSVYLQTVVPVRLLAIFDRLAPLFGAELSSDPQNQCDTCPLSVLG